jgi:hypothetical protein
MLAEVKIKIGLLIIFNIGAGRSIETMSTGLANRNSIRLLSF